MFCGEIMNEEDRARILETAYANLANADVERREFAETKSEPAKFANSDFRDVRRERHTLATDWRRRGPPPHAPARPRKLDTPVPTWQQIDQRVAEAIEVERAFWTERFLPHLVATLRDETQKAIDQARAATVEQIVTAKSKLNAEIAEARLAIADLKVVIAERNAREARASPFDLSGPGAPRPKIH